MKKICEITAEGLPAIEEVTNLAEGVCPVCQAARIARKAHGAICGHEHLLPRRYVSALPDPGGYLQRPGQCGGSGPAEGLL